MCLEVLDDILQLPLREDVDLSPSEEEVLKKGNLSSGDNWRGISLLDVMRRYSPRLSRKNCRLWLRRSYQTHCEFRSSRGCIDMIYCARQLVEKAREHSTQIFMLFIDLRKTYDCIPRSPLRRMLEKYGIPPALLSIICSLHDGMKAEVTVDGNLTPYF